MNINKTKVYTVIFHVVCWTLVAVPTITFAPGHEQPDTLLYLLRLSTPILMCMIFYINYLWLMPQYYIKHKLNVFIAVNIIVIVLSAIITQIIGEQMHLREMYLEISRSVHHHEPHISQVTRITIIIVRNIFPLIISAVLAVLLRLALEWQKAERARKEMEIQKTDAELRNLRNQINPHFLLNTLNNIYALISFNQEKAQKAVLSLSNLLRQMLYSDQEISISLKEETTFLRDYIDLMSIRMSKNVEVKINISIPENEDIYIAPLILISLVENAFKHGVSQTSPCFISVDVKADARKIECEIRNSNFPKNSSDKSGHGIGLEQVAKRLEMAYKDKYTWERGVDTESNTYVSKIVIYDTKLRNN